VQVLVDNVLDSWCEVDPARITVKPKLHLLTHLVENLRRFGPAILYSTEIFECWNAVFRFCSILSNHQSPSHDIATTLSDMERFKHQVSGGFWKDSATGKYIQAGEKIRAFMKGKTELQRRLGWVEQKSVPAGMWYHSSAHCWLNNLMILRNIQAACKEQDQRCSMGRDRFGCCTCGSAIHSGSMRDSRMEIL
jgi:hypothetical protein